MINTPSQGRPVQRFLIFVASLAWSAPAAEHADQPLIRISQVRLEKSGGQVDQVIPLPDGGGFVVRDYSWEQEQNQAVEVYDRQGRFLRKIGTFGRGPGRYFRLKSAALTKDETLWVGDGNGRISLFSLSGELAESMTPVPGPRIRDIALDEDRGYYYLAGCLPKAVYLDRGCQLVHQYTLEARAYRRSFIETDPEALTNNWLAIEDYSIAVDHEGRVFMTDAPVMKLFRYDPSTARTDVFVIESDTYKPPPPIESPRLNQAVRDSSFLLERTVVAGRYVVVSLAAPRTSGRSYTLQVFDTEGRQILTDVASPGRLVGRDRDGVLIFAISDSKGFELEGYQLRTTDDSGEKSR